MARRKLVTGGAPKILPTGIRIHAGGFPVAETKESQTKVPQKITLCYDFQ